MKHVEAWILIIVCALACVVPGRATNMTADDGENIISRIDRRMAILDSLIFSAKAPAAVPNALAGSVAVSPDSIYSAGVDAVVDARISEIKAQTGIQITGQTYYRADGAMGLDDEDEAVSRYTGKIQAEARWYFLQSGLLKRGSRMEEQRIKGDIDRLEHENGRSDPAIYSRRERLHTISDSILASIMLHRVDNLALLEEAYMHLLSNENISGEDLLRILDERAEAERRLATVAVTPMKALSLSSVTAGTVRIDTAAVISALSDTDIPLQLLDLRARLLDCQTSNTTWWSDVRVAPFVRYSHYFRHALPSSNNVDVGVSFTVPVNAEASRRRRELMAQKSLLEHEKTDMLARAADKARYLALETERLNRSITGEWERASSLRSYLSERRNAYNHREGEYNRLAALKGYNSYLRCLENIIEMQYRRDCLIADLQALVPAVPVLDFCTFTPLSLQ